MIIGLSGSIGSGKTTVATYIQSEYGYQPLSFATALKDTVSTVMRWDRELLEGTTQESREWRETVDQWWSNRLGIPNLTPRSVLQNLGTELFRNHFNPDIWVANIEQQLNLYHNVVLTDCRYLNELALADKTILIVRDKYSSNYEFQYHTFDYIINNTESLKGLYKRIDSVLGTIHHTHKRV